MQARLDGQGSGGVTAEGPAGRDHQPVLEFRGVSKHFGAVRALSNVSLALYAGEVLGLVGDNGAGKSTFVNLASGTLQPDEGEILVDGVSHRFTTPADARAVGIETVFQMLSLIMTLDITENVYLNREEYGPGPMWRLLRRMDTKRMRREVVDGFERLGLTLPDPRTKVGALSGGQRQAVAIARAVLWGTHIVILDEPSAALGVKQTEIVLSFVERLRAHGVATIFISHNMQHVLRVADRIAVMRLGEKVVDAAKTNMSGDKLVSYITGTTAGTAERTGHH